MAWDYRNRLGGEPGAETITKHFDNLLSADVFLQTEGAQQIVQWLQSADPALIDDALDIMVTRGAVKKFVELYRSSTPTLEALAGVIFGFLACGETRHATIAFNSGIIPICIERLSSPDLEARIKSAWILGNLAADETECAETLTDQGVLNIMVEQMEIITNANEISAHGPYATMLLWAINHFLKSAPNLSPAILIRISQLLCIIIVADVEDVVLEESCFGLAALTQIEEESPFSNEKLCGRLIRLLQRGSNVNLQKAALQLIGALTARSEEYTTRLLHFDLLSVLHELIEHKLGEDACWVISNIVADNIDHLNIVVKDPRIIPTIIRILKVDAAGFDEDEFAGRTRECCSILANIINKGQVDSIRHTVGLGGISALCTALKFCVETETLILLLDTLWKVVLFGESDRIVINDKPVNLYFELFKESGGYEGLARLAFRKDQQVADAAQQMAILLDEIEDPTSRDNEGGQLDDAMSPDVSKTEAPSP